MVETLSKDFTSSSKVLLLPKPYNSSTTSGYVNPHSPVACHVHSLASCYVMQQNGLAILQLIVVAIAVKGHARDSIATIGHEPLNVRLTVIAWRHLERVSLDRSRIVVEILVSRRVIVFHHIDYDHPIQLPVKISSVRAFLLVWQRQVCNRRRIVDNVSQERSYGNISVVRSFSAFACLTRLFGLPRLVSIIGTLMPKRQESKDQQVSRISRIHQSTYMCVRRILFVAHQRLKSTPHNAAPNELESPGFPSLYKEFVSPRMNGKSGFRSFGSAASSRDSLRCLAIEATVDE